MAKKILVVDDDPNARKVFGDILAGYGYDVIEAGGYREAVEAARKEKPGVVLLDTALPRIDCIELCRCIKEEGNKAPKVVVYTQVIDVADAERARKAGADDYVVKTSDLSHLLKAIEDLI